ncbi:hypothetical protein Taro_042526 [Colocasia esculenta]|uniref:GOLD domain-containing protein n=1 Tax=Colocasia esculenta TaxID=4460 RepID=A0A843X2S3_COLES|nr:hypothetical protein [Colocasia esculenta]
MLRARPLGCAICPGGQALSISLQNKIILTFEKIKSLIYILTLFPTLTWFHQKGPITSRNSPVRTSPPPNTSTPDIPPPGWPGSEPFSFPSSLLRSPLSEALRSISEIGIRNASSLSSAALRSTHGLAGGRELQDGDKIPNNRCLEPLSASGIRFVIDREECFSHQVPYEGDIVHVSFVVIKAENSWHYGDDGVDLLVKGPSGEQIHDSRDKTSEKFEFTVHKKGLHRFCFTNKSPYHETVDFDVHVGHFSHFGQHAKDEHFAPLFEQIAKLEEALYNVQFEQHWLEAQTDRQAVVNEGMSRGAVHKALFESAALIGASVLQVYLLRRLFERKLGTSRV